MITNDDLEMLATLGFELVNLKPGGFSQYTEKDCHEYSLEQVEQAIKHVNTLCIDLDTKKGKGTHAEQINAFEHYFGLSECLAVATKSGGRHYLFQTSPIKQKLMGRKLQLDEVEVTFDVLTGNNLSFLRLSDPSKEYTLLSPSPLNIERLQQPPNAFLEYIEKLQAEEANKKEKKSTQTTTINIEEVKCALKTIALIHGSFNSFQSFLRTKRGESFYSGVLDNLFFPIHSIIGNSEETRNLLVSHFFKYLEGCDYNLVRAELNKMQPNDSKKKMEGRIEINTLFKLMQESRAVDEDVYTAVYVKFKEKHAINIIEDFDTLKEVAPQANEEQSEKEPEEVASEALFYEICKAKTRKKNEAAKAFLSELQQLFPNSKFLLYFIELFNRDVYPKRIMKLIDVEDYANYEEMLVALWFLCSCAVGNTYRVNINNYFTDNKVCNAYIMHFDRSANGKGVLGNFIRRITDSMEAGEYPSITKSSAPASGQSFINSNKNSLMARNMVALEDECSNGEFMQVLTKSASEMNSMQRTLNTSATTLYSDGYIPGVQSLHGLSSKDIFLVSLNYFGTTQPYHVPNPKQLNTGLFGRFQFCMPTALPLSSFKEFEPEEKDEYSEASEVIHSDENKLASLFSGMKKYYKDAGEIKFSTAREKQEIDEKYSYLSELLNDVCLGIKGNNEFTRLLSSSANHSYKRQKASRCYTTADKKEAGLKNYEHYEFEQFVVLYRTQSEIGEVVEENEKEGKKKKAKEKEPNYKEIFIEYITNKQSQIFLEKAYKQNFNLKVEVDIEGYSKSLQNNELFKEDYQQRLFHKVNYAITALLIVLGKERDESCTEIVCPFEVYNALTQFFYIQSDFFFDIAARTGKAEIKSKDFQEANKQNINKVIIKIKNLFGRRIKNAKTRKQTKTTISLQIITKKVQMTDMPISKRKELIEHAFLEIKKSEAGTLIMNWQYKRPDCKPRIDDSIEFIMEEK